MTDDPLFQRAEQAIKESYRVGAETGESLLRARIAIASAKRTYQSTCAEHALIWPYPPVNGWLGSRGS